MKKKVASKKLALKAVLILNIAASHANADDLIEGDIRAFYFDTEYYISHSATGSRCSRGIEKALPASFVVSVASFDGQRDHYRNVKKTWKSLNLHHVVFNLAEA